METYLYYSYLKFRQDRKKSIRLVIKSIPWWIWLPLLMGIFGTVTFCVTYQNEHGELWRKLMMLVSLACFYFVGIGVETIQIRDSRERLENFWVYIHKVREFLEGSGIRTSEDIAQIKIRIDQKLETLRSNQQVLRERDEKWVQTLAIPVVLTMISPVVNNSGDLTTMVSNCVSILIVFSLLIIVVSVGAITMRSFPRREIENLECFSEDLQGVLDLERFEIAKKEVSECK